MIVEINRYFKEGDILTLRDGHRTEVTVVFNNCTENKYLCRKSNGELIYINEDIGFMLQSLEEPVEIEQFKTIFKKGDFITIYSRMLYDKIIIEIGSIDSNEGIKYSRKIIMDYSKEEIVDDPMGYVDKYIQFEDISTIRFSTEDEIKLLKNLRPRNP